MYKQKGGSNIGKTTNFIHYPYPKYGKDASCLIYTSVSKILTLLLKKQQNLTQFFMESFHILLQRVAKNQRLQKDIQACLSLPLYRPNNK